MIVVLYTYRLFA